jgi:hypothetical protein
VKSQDPTRRPDGVWPGDRQVRWRRVAGNLTWFVFGTAAALLQLALAVPVLAMGGGAAGTILALVWGALTLFAAWSWIRGRWRVLLAPAATIAAILVRLVAGGL